MRTREGQHLGLVRCLLSLYYFFIFSSLITLSIIIPLELAYGDEVRCDPCGGSLGSRSVVGREDEVEERERLADYVCGSNRWCGEVLLRMMVISLRDEIEELGSFCLV